jgi:hypothetical protein
MWLSCPASVTMTRDVTRPSSKFAREGTAAHQVAEMTLNGDIFLPDKVTVEGDEYVVSPGMCRALNPYVSYVQSLQALPGARVFLEQRLAVPQTNGKVWGTHDCGAIAQGEMFVADLKFGRGVAVDPSGPQLKLYALALAGHVGVADVRTRVTLTICQPRIGGEPLRQHVTTFYDLMEWRRSEVRPAVKRIAAGDTTEVAGAHCRWCVRKTECAAFANKHQTHAASAFDDGGGP